ncbi:unnamed protein product [Lota lota]
MTGLPVGSLPSSMSSAAVVARVGGEGERERSEELDELVPLDRLPSGGDFRGKFRKMRQRKRPTILESDVAPKASYSCLKSLLDPRIETVTARKSP